MIFESQLRRRQKEVEVLLQEKESTIRQQQQVILSLSRALNTTQAKQEPAILTEKAIESRVEDVEKKEKQNGTDDENTLKKSNDKFLSSLTTSSKSDPESLNDSDSAIMLEDNFDSLVLIPLGKGEVKVVRSVSDAVEVASRSSCSGSTSVAGDASSLLKPGFNNCNRPGSLSTSPSCSSEESDDSPSCTLTKGRAELLRTVYSLEEEEVCHTLPEHDTLSDDATSVAPSLHSILKASSHYDSDATLSDGESEEEEDEGSQHIEDSSNDRRQLLGSFEKLNTLGATPVRVKAEEEIQVTYNRVMSNHRSVTKPKDVKYRRINKAKSRSLEELRGKLKYWTDRSGKQSLSVDLNNHSFA